MYLNVRFSTCIFYANLFLFKKRAGILLLLILGQLRWRKLHQWMQVRSQHAAGCCCVHAKHLNLEVGCVWGRETIMALEMILQEAFNPAQLESSDSQNEALQGRHSMEDYGECYLWYATSLSVSLSKPHKMRHREGPSGKNFWPVSCSDVCHGRRMVSKSSSVWSDR